MIQSNPIQSNPIQSNLIPIQIDVVVVVVVIAFLFSVDHNLIQSNPIQFNLIQSNPIQSDPMIPFGNLLTIALVALNLILTFSLKPLGSLELLLVYVIYDLIATTCLYGAYD